MSVEYYKFHCPQCDTEKELCEGMLLFSKECYYIMKCPICNRIESIPLTEIEYHEKRFPMCCGVKMVEWNRRCPQCGKEMEEKLGYSDVI